MDYKFWFWAILVYAVAQLVQSVWVTLLSVKNSKLSKKIILKHVQSYDLLSQLYNVLKNENIFYREVLDKTKKTRQREIEEGKHAQTVPPLYVVYDELISVCERDSAYTQSTTRFDEFADEFRRFSDDGSWIEAESDSSKWDEKITVDEIEYNSVVRVGFHDGFVTCCLTSEAAEEFIEREKHNLKNPRIFVHGIWRRNLQMVQLGILLGDKD